MTDLVKRVIVDVDVGTDDAIALLIFLYAMKLGILKIEAIICTSGNTGRGNVVRNLVRVLEMTGHTDIPIYRGALRPFVASPIDVFTYYGKDGFGDLKYDHEPDISIVRDTFGAKAIHDLVEQNPKEISMVSFAPLTNIALADRLYDNFMDNVKDIWIVGGVHGTSEFNFLMDPEAAYILLNDIQQKTPVYILPWKTCISSPITWEWISKVLGNSPHPIMKLLHRAEENVHKENVTIWKCCDGQLAAAFLYEDRFIKLRNNYSLSVELHGSQTRGRVIVYRPERREMNAVVIEAIDYNMFREVLLSVSDIQAYSSGDTCSWGTRLTLTFIVLFVISHL